MSTSTGRTVVTGLEQDLPPAAQLTKQYEGHDHGSVARSDLIRICLVGIAVVFCWLRVWEPFKLDIIGLAAVLVGGYPIYREVLIDIFSRRMTMELSMTIALAAALVIREVFTALVIVFFVLTAEALEELTVGRGRQAIRDLLTFLPATAERKTASDFETVPVSALGRGDVVIIRPGGRIPVDGEGVHGHSFVDPSTINGESVPVEKEPGSRVFAGTMSQTGALEVQTVGIGRDTAFGKIKIGRA